MKSDNNFLKWFYGYGAIAFLLAGVLNIYTLLLTYRVLFLSQLITSIIFTVFYFLLSYNFFRMYRAQALVLKEMSKEITSEEVDKIIQGAS